METEWQMTVMREIRWQVTVMVNPGYTGSAAKSKGPYLLRKFADDSDHMWMADWRRQVDQL
jgi:hypothetical protein